MVRQAIVLFISLAAVAPASPAPTAAPRDAIRTPSVDAQREAISRLRTKIGPAGVARLQREAKEMVTSTTRLMKARARRGREVNPARPPRALRQRLEQLTRSYATASGERDVTEVLRGVMMMAMAGVEEDLRVMAARLHAINDAKASLREDMSELREVMTGGQFPAELIYTRHATAADGAVTSREQTVTLASAAEAQALLEDLERQYETMTDVSEQLQLQLQDAMQKQQQAMALLSAMMKNQHDTLKAIIDNMRG